MKLKATVSGALVIAVVSQFAWSAETPAPAAPRVMPTVMAPQIIQSNDGNLNFNTNDLGKLFDNASLEIINRSKDDKEFLEKTMNTLLTQYNHINTDIYHNQLEKWADNTRVSFNSAVNVKEFQAAKRDYESARDSYMAQLDVIKAIPSGALPSAHLPVGPNGAAVDVAAYRSVNVGPIVADFTQKMKDLDAKINALRTNVIDGNGIQQKNVAGFNVDYSKITLLTPKERTELQASINDKKKSMRNLFVNQDKLTGFTVESLDAFMDLFGSSTQYWKTDSGFNPAMKAKYDELKELMWARSFLRLKYGWGVGTMMMSYKKQWGNIEQVFRDPHAVIDLDEAKRLRNHMYVAVRSKPDLDRAQEAVRLNITLAKDRTTDVSSMFEQVKAGSSAPFALIGSVFTYFTGRRLMMETGQNMLKYVAADINEEALVNKGGKMGMIDYYFARYLSTPEDKKATRELECRYDADFTKGYTQAVEGTAADCPDSLLTDSLAQGNTLTYYTQVNNEAKGQIQNLELAQTLQAQLDEAAGLTKVNDQLIKGFRRR